MFQIGKSVRLRGRIVASRFTGKMQFIKLKYQQQTVQVVSDKKVDVAKDSIVTVQGAMVGARVESCTVKDAEVQLKSMKVESQSERSPYEPQASLDTLLNHRTVSLRDDHAIFRLQHVVVKEFRRFLDERGFLEIYTPKLISAASEGGANVFKVDYFGKDAFLAQSPQLYKQMAIGADFGKVYEVGPVFRAENSNTHRHLTEFTGLDLEMAVNEDYHEVVELIGELMVSIFKKLQSQTQLLQQVQSYDEFKFLEKTLVLKHKEAIDMLKGQNVEIGYHDDFSTEQERLLGKMVKEKYHTDFFILDKFPLSIRPFYTMPDEDDPTFSNSYDIYMRGEEIMSGAQRIHNYSQLLERVKECKIDPQSIKSYLDSFRYGVPPHAGGGLGLNRIVMLFLDLKNIRRATMFPRDPKRLEP